MSHKAKIGQTIVVTGHEGVINSLPLGTKVVVKEFFDMTEYGNLELKGVKHYIGNNLYCIRECNYKVCDVPKECSLDNGVECEYCK